MHKIRRRIVNLNKLPMDLNVKHLNQRSLILEPAMIEGNTLESLEKSGDARPIGNSMDNSVSSLDFNYGISNESIIDFGYLQFYGDQIDQSYDSAPLNSDVVFPYLNGNYHRLTFTTNEVNYSQINCLHIEFTKN